MFLGEDWARYKDILSKPKREGDEAKSSAFSDFLKLVNAARTRSSTGDRVVHRRGRVLQVMAATAIIANLDSSSEWATTTVCTSTRDEQVPLHPVRISTWRWAASRCSAHRNSKWIESHQALRRPVQVAERLLANQGFADNYQQILKEVVPLCFAKERCC